MSLDRAFILSSYRHFGPFLCPICQCLPEKESALVTIPCSHVFCRLCIETWLQKSDTCPTCNTNVTYSAAASTKSTNSMVYPPSFSTMMVAHRAVYLQPLSRVQPLADRILRRIKVCCPMKVKHGCTWKGDYGDLQDHLLSGSAHMEDDGSRTAPRSRLGPETLVNPNMEQNVMHKNHWKRGGTCQSSEKKNVDSEEEEDGSRTDSCDDQNSETEIPMDRMEDVMDHSSHVDSNGYDHEHAHRVSSLEQRIHDSEKQRRSLADSFKEEANAKFASQNYTESRDLYTRALSALNSHGNTNSATSNNSKNSNSLLGTSSCPPTFQQPETRLLAAILYSNRAATYFMRKEYTKAIDDCNMAISIDGTYTKSYLRKSKALIQLGQFDDACTILQELLEGNRLDQSIPSSQSLIQTIRIDLSLAQRLRSTMETGLKQLFRKEFADAKVTFAPLLIETNAPSVLLSAAKADLGLGYTESALRFSLQLLRQNPQWEEAYLLRAETMYLMGDFEAAATLLKEVLRLSPDHEGAKMWLRRCRDVQRRLKDAREAVFYRRFEQAVERFSSILAQEGGDIPRKSPMYAIIHSERGECYVRLKMYEQALKDASLIVYVQDDSVPGWLLMVKALHGLERHEDALSQLNSLMQKWGSANEDIRRAYEKADFEVRKHKRPDLYGLFGVSELATMTELKKAYKAKALELHPDRMVGNKYTDADRKEAEKKFKLLGEGLEILSDDFKRQLWDHGYDQEAIRERVEMAKRAAHRHGHGR